MIATTVRHCSSSSSARTDCARGLIVKPSRAIPSKTSLFLYVHAGGRCEFDGCNKYLLEHNPTQTPGNFAEQAHIYAFKEAGPRGDRDERPSDINDLSNLMLLCPECHHLIDVVRPDDYPVEVLRRFKQDHEDRYALTALAKDRDTVPLVLKALVAGRAMDISDEEMQRAVAPNYLVRRQKVEIDLTAIPDSVAVPTGTMPAPRSITSLINSRGSSRVRAARCESRCSRSHRCHCWSIWAHGSATNRWWTSISVIAILSPGVGVRVGGAQFATRCATQAGDDVALLVNVSGQDTTDSVTRSMGACTVYELAVSGLAPTPLVLKTRGDPERFTAEYVRALATIRTAYPSLKRVHVFPAVPAPLAIVMGRMRLPKVDRPFWCTTAISVSAALFRPLRSLSA